MKERSFDARRFDVAEFCRAQAALSGEFPLAHMTRLSSGTSPLADGTSAVALWRVSGAARPVAGGASELSMQLQARATVALECQRCLSAMPCELVVDRRFLFARDEDQAERLDEQSEDDVLVLSRHLDLQELVEDELILELPIVPRHDRCPEPLPVAEAEPAAGAADAAEPSPFAVLAGLKVGGAK